LANLLNTQQLKDSYLVGIKQVDQNGNAYSNNLYDTAIKSAVSYFELKTKIHVTPYEIPDEPHDYYVTDYDRFAFFQLYEYPILNVSSISAIYPTGQTILLFPSTWIKINYKVGQLNLVPTAGSLSQVLIGQGGSYLPLLNGALSWLPQLFHVTYTAGFDTGKIPDAVNDAIGLRAGIHVMSAAGSTVIESGIQSKSTSIDGLSQSAAAMVGQFGPYSGRINEYQKRLDDLLDTITQEYKGVRLTVL
jgi:hypothetical protein